MSIIVYHCFFVPCVTKESYILIIINPFISLLFAEPLNLTLQLQIIESCVGNSNENILCV